MKQLRLARIPSAIATLPRRLKFPFISCPVNVRIQEVGLRWASAARTNLRSDTSCMRDLLIARPLHAFVRRGLINKWDQPGGLCSITFVPGESFRQVRLLLHQGPHDAETPVHGQR